MTGIRQNADTSAANEVSNRFVTVAAVYLA
jgi:hypothetical protein